MRNIKRSISILLTAVILVSFAALAGCAAKQVTVPDVKGMTKEAAEKTITDLGLNEFRLDLLDYIKTHGSSDNKPLGLHAVAEANDNPAGVIFVLKNRNRAVNPVSRPINFNRHCLTEIVYFDRNI